MGLLNPFYGRKDLVYIMSNSLIKVLLNLCILSTKTNDQITAMSLWIALSSHIKTYSRIRRNLSLTPMCMPLKSTPQTLPTLCWKRMPSTGSILRSLLVCSPKSNGSFPKRGGGSFFHSENEIVLSIIPKPRQLLQRGSRASVTRLLPIYHKSQVIQVVNSQPV